MRNEEKEETLTYSYPDIVLYLCPFECDGKICEQEWINEQLDNKIICRCRKCDHKEGEASSNRVVPCK